MDPALMEQYANYLDEMERSDPNAYKAFMEEMRSKVTAGGDGLSMEALQAAMASAPASNGANDDLRFPGNKVMQSEGLAEQKEGMYVDVEPGFVMKTKELASKTKLFVNFCTCEHIKIFSKQKKLDENGEEQEGIHVPLSLGPPHEVLDHAKKTCLAIDVAVNPQVVLDADADSSGTFRNFLCELAIQYIEEKYKFQVDPQYKLPKLSYRGELPPAKHYIRKAQTPTIEEPLMGILMESVASNEWRVCAQVPACEGGPALSKAHLASAPRHLQMRFEFPSAVTSPKDIQVHARAEYLVVNVPGYVEHATYLPYPIDASGVTADYAAANQALTIAMAVDATFHAQQLAPDAGSAPWMLSQALDDGSDDVRKEPSLADKFQLEPTVLPATVESPITEEDELPEDRFHRKDMLSMHILDQRKADRAEKAKKSEDERKARKAENDVKVAAAKAAGKTWREMYPNEPETTFVDLGEMLQKEAATVIAEPQAMPESEIAKTVKTEWTGATKMEFASSLAFELLD
ncbi:hypothetical protein SDRG_03704 [Saprolegnia diclina VS20]|uniref:PIH1 N-terminal domain-containing protein n=1 Tax=Saprolegnia diclina (strain VS20) TaxID=1156394 RepID=T0QXF2_SAPDV|nr:hypothetical protein SDRG_03704 [Saprolegnia diclina VS20]EQC38740.1 hypothetical protein SDRG_03704 [Saprolegnia diclina VS20]|eukprot:XP_008607564.1 hypothetical protein SDRG_03704 [Saprolegnia diclina VS20]